jgi:hypothetical protein
MQTQGSMATCEVPSVNCQPVPIFTTRMHHVNAMPTALLACPVWSSACCAESPVPTAVASWAGQRNARSMFNKVGSLRSKWGCCESKDAFSHADCLAGEEIVALWPKPTAHLALRAHKRGTKDPGSRVPPVPIPCQQKYSRAARSVRRPAILSILPCLPKCPHKALPPCKKTCNIVHPPCLPKCPHKATWEATGTSSASIVFRHKKVE